MELTRVSWLRTYHCPVGLPLSTSSDSRDLVPPSAEALTQQDLRDLAFFDLQMIDQGAVMRFRLRGISLELPGLDEVDATLHYLFHVSGFLVLRLTCELNERKTIPKAGGPHSEIELANELYQLFWQADKRVKWALDGQGVPELSVREILTFFFLGVGRGDGRGQFDDPDFLMNAAEDARHEFDELSKLVNDEDKPFSFVYPVSGVSHFEFEATDPQDHKKGLEEFLYQGLEVERKENAPARRGEWWGVNDNISLSVSERGSPGEGSLLSSVRPVRTQLVEMLALRLGVLWSIQRDTQRFLITGRELPNKTLAEWQKALLTANDDWTLDGRIGGRLATLERLLDSTSGARSIRRLREQVSVSIAAFQRRFDVAGQRATGILAVVFSIVATTSLASILWVALAGEKRQTAEVWISENWRVVAGVELGLIVLAGAGIWLWFRLSAGRISFRSK